jgi:hypothetical protein
MDGWMYKLIDDDPRRRIIVVVQRSNVSDSAFMKRYEFEKKGFTDARIVIMKDERCFAQGA